MLATATTTSTRRRSRFPTEPSRSRQHPLGRPQTAVRLALTGLSEGVSFLTVVLIILVIAVVGYLLATLIQPERF